MNTFSKIREEESEEKRETTSQEVEEEEEEKDLNKLKPLNNNKLPKEPQPKPPLEKTFILNDVYSIY